MSWFWRRSRRRDRCAGASSARTCSSPDPILFQRHVFRIAYQLLPGLRRIEWNLDECFDNDLAHVSGFGELHEMADGRTLGRSGSSIDVGPAVPAILQDWITRKDVPETMKRVRMWVDSKGTYRP